jgi:hypothetical protein
MKKRLFREPLLHFLLLGACLFGLYAWIGGPEQAEDNSRRIVVSNADIQWIQTTWLKRWGRPPSETELENMIQDFVREQVLYREALAMGLDRDDVIIRRRMATKMQFLFNDLAEREELTEEDIQQWFEAHIKDYVKPEHVSFEHIYFNVDRRGEKATKDAEALLAKLKLSEISSDSLHQHGDSFMLQSEYPLKSQSEIRQLFGIDFSQSLFQLETGSWQGPIASSYGLHLVRVNHRAEATTPTFEAIRERARNDLISERRRLANEKFYENLRERYDVVIADISPSMPENERLVTTSSD